MYQYFLKIIEGHFGEKSFYIKSAQYFFHRGVSHRDWTIHNFPPKSIPFFSTNYSQAARSTLMTYLRVERVVEQVEVARVLLGELSLQGDGVTVAGK